MNIIETNKLTKYFNGARGIIDVDLEVKEGEIFGFIGPNGSGKSTTIRTLLNFIYPTSGEAKVLGKNCINDSSVIKKHVGYVPGEVNYYGNMRAGEILRYAGSFYDSYDVDRVKRLCDIFQVESNKKMRELSLGNKKKIAIVQALISQPKLLILDEPANGLDPLMQKRLFEVLNEENKKGMTIFFSSHNLSEVQKFCHRVAVIKEGKIIEVKTLEEMLESNIKIVKVKAKEDLANGIELLKARGIEREGELIKFIYDGDVNKLIRFLANKDIAELQITEPSLEDTFLEFYQKEEK